MLYSLFKVNIQPIFICVDNWILLDGLLCLSKEYYKTDIKFHADMNLNMIRHWGGGLAERPKFYHCCDIYGLLVISLSLSLSLCVCDVNVINFMECSRKVEQATAQGT